VLKDCIGFAKILRDAGINTELYPDDVKMKKQMSYANANNIPWVVLVGSEEMKLGILKLKNMTSGEQSDVTMPALIKMVTNNQ
jgi:histidyl-tRNA synthetase